MWKAQLLCGGREGSLEPEGGEVENGEWDGLHAKWQFTFPVLIFLCQPWIHKNERVLWHHEG